LGGGLEAGVAPLAELEQALARSLEQRLAVETELREARAPVESADAALRALDEQRLGCETKVEEAR